MKLSDFKDEKAVEIIAKLLVPIGRMAADSKNLEARKQGKLAFISALLQNNAKDVQTMLAILHEEDPEAYHCDGATVLVDTLEMMNDPALVSLFGLRSQAPASSGSASMTGEAEEESPDS